MNAIWKQERETNVAVLSASFSQDKQSVRAAKLPPIQFHPLHGLRQRLDQIEVRDRKFAEFLYKAIPAQCPFERDIKLFGRKVAHIPPLCKLNPLYDQLVGLRFRALCYLVDRCGIDIQTSWN